MPSYKFARPSIATDVVTLRFHRPRPEDEKRLEVLLIERKEKPLGWALPGGFLRVGAPKIEAAAARGKHQSNIDWTLEDCARRELLEEAGADPYYLHQFGAYGAANRDPRGRYISVAYWALVHEDRCDPKAGSDAKQVAWRPVNDLRDLAFDHESIVKDALADMRRRRLELELFLDLMPDVFTYPMFLEAYQPFWSVDGDRNGDRERDLANLRSNLHRKVRTLWKDAGAEGPLKEEQRRGPGAEAKRYDLKKVKMAYQKASSCAPFQPFGEQRKSAPELAYTPRPIP
jgi:8-oxo-dGTP diphosphatase